jgi:hypothetical protein
VFTNKELPESKILSLGITSPGGGCVSPSSVAQSQVVQSGYVNIGSEIIIGESNEHDSDPHPVQIPGQFTLNPKKSPTLFITHIKKQMDATILKSM